MDRKRGEKMKKRNNLSLTYNMNAWFFASIFLCLWAFFLVLPFIASFFMSFLSCKGSVCQFVGFGNISRLIHDKIFWIALSNTMLFLIVQVPIMLILGLVYANLLNSPKLKGRNIYRTMLFIPCVTSLVAYSVVFKMMFSTDGLVNSVLLGIGLIDNGVNWITNPVTAKIVIIIGLIWRWTGYNMVFYLAGMQAIPSEIYEAAKIDGASSVKTFLRVTIPHLKPIIFFTSITSTIGTLQLFDEVVNITGGGPGYATTTLSQYIYRVSFMTDIDMGYAATISYAIVVIVLILAIIQKKVAGE